MFYYYRGPSSSPTQIDVQLENNTTKALVNVLDSCSNSTSTKLLNALVGFEITKGSEKIHLALHEGSIGAERITSMKKRVLLGISPNGIVRQSDSNPKQRDTPDAWVWGRDFAILIENKTRGELLSGQLARYRRILGTCKVITRSWINEVYPVVRSMANGNDLNEKDKLLISQLGTYLEISRLSEFAGFELQDFTRVHSEDPEEREYVHHKFELLAKQVAPRMSKWNLQHYQGGDRAWHGVVRRFRSYPCYQMAHFAFFEEDYGVGVKLHIGGGPDLGSLRAKLRHQSSREKLIEHLMRLRKSDRDYEITVYERETARPYRTDEASGITVQSTYATKKRLSRLVSFLSDIHKPWFSIYYTIEPTDAVGMGKSIIDDITSIFKEFRPTYLFITNH